MASYQIYTLDKSEVSVSGGESLDGVTQGDGSHLEGETITLDSNNWQAIDISDNDSSFGDSDSGQSLDGPQTINGISYASGTTVEAEYQLTVSDGTTTYEVIAFNVNNSSPAYGTVEGLAFIGGFPPTGVPLTVQTATEGPNFLAADYAVPCFASGTLIDTPDGPAPVERLRAGDMVLTADRGPQSLWWIGSTTVAAIGAHAPIHLPPGALGNTRALRLSPEHRVLIGGWRAELLFGTDNVLVAAKHLVGHGGIHRASGGSVTYHHLMCERHEILFAEGAATESFHVGDTILDRMQAATRAELLTLFPELAAPTRAARQTVRPCLRGYEAIVLSAA
ncbi:Hint domain-containing protein [Salibaculum sp.]|uniref:Hint domain-containing protein n=1 Tax=Salibaculum sp. TaxID=2855480 RepID=UPI002B48DD51|nr:Hint domain-containing protein [Salibaculum sp.]HKL70907.1 Hint domain-containing protein [Salibaculum sp.]